MNILVTGGAGYIGSHVVLALQAAGHQIVILDNLQTGKQQLIPANTTFIQGDVGDPALLETVCKQARPNAVVHLAASTQVAASVADPAAYYRNNTLGALLLAQTCTNNNIEYFIFSSTAAVYAPSDIPVNETAACVPINPYGKSKLMAETILADIGLARSLQWSILRYFNVCGADSQLRTGDCQDDPSTLIAKAVKCATGQCDSIPVFGHDYDTPDGTAIRDFVHVTDVATAHLLALNHLVSGGQNQIFNIGTGTGTGTGSSVQQVIDTLKIIAGENFKTELHPRRIGDADKSICNPQKARQLLGFKPQYTTLDTIIESCLRWERFRLDTISPKKYSTAPTHNSNR